MNETSKQMSPFSALAFLVWVLKNRPECRINLLVGKRIKVTVLETGTTVAQELSTF